MRADDKHDDDYSDEAERKVIRDQLYADLKWAGGPFVYPSKYPDQHPVGKDRDTEPSLELWRRGYLVLKAKEGQRRFILMGCVLFALFCAALWALDYAGWI